MAPYLYLKAPRRGVTRSLSLAVVHGSLRPASRLGYRGFSGVEIASVRVLYELCLPPASPRRDVETFHREGSRLGVCRAAGVVFGVGEGRI